MPMIDLNKKKVWGPLDVMSFGKYKGQTVKEVLRKDASILIWYDENVEYFNLDDDVRQQAEEMKYGQRQRDRETSKITRGSQYTDLGDDLDDDIPF